MTALHPRPRPGRQAIQLGQAPACVHPWGRGACGKEGAWPPGLHKIEERRIQKKRKEGPWRGKVVYDYCDEMIIKWKRGKRMKRGGRGCYKEEEELLKYDQFVWSTFEGTSQKQALVKGKKRGRGEDIEKSVWVTKAQNTFAWWGHL